MKVKSTKKALLSAVLSLVVCIAMLVGSTFAWFTDNVVSANNIIKSGNLDVTLEWMDGTKEVADVDDAAWLDASTDAIFSYDLWEPGFTQVRHIKIGNEGSLALKYKVVIETEAADIDLAKVIDVYYFDPAEQVAGREALKDVTPLGTLDNVLGNMNATAAGELAANTDDVITIALKMQETAGNEYMNKSVGGKFTIKLYATQLAAEEDSFGKDYDSLADYDGEISTVSALQVALEEGGSYKVVDSFTVPAGVLPTIPEGVTVALDLNGNSITVENTAAEYALNNLGNLTLWDSKATSTYSLRRSSAGSINARGIYNGYDKDGNHVTSAKITVLNGVYNAMGTNGGAAIFNYGIVDIKDGTFTSIGGYSLNNQSGGVMTIDHAVTTGGIYNLGELVVNDGEISNNRSGAHSVYNAGTVEINGGNFSNESGNETINSTNANVTINGGTFTQIGKAYLFGAGNAGIVINGGIFNGYVNSDGTNDKMRPGAAVVKGGTFNFDVSEWLNEGCEVIENADGTWLVADVKGKTEVASGLYKGEDADYYVYTADGFAYLNAIMADKSAGKNVVINLKANLDMAGKTWTTVDSQADAECTFKALYGNGFTISNLTVNGQAMFKRFANFGDVEIKDVTFDNAKVNSNGAINTSILTVQSYQNVLLDNVDIVNSTINGGYKVAPYIATVYDEESTTVIATLKDCDVSNTTVKATVYDFCTTGMVAFVYAGSNDKIEFENCTVTNVKLYAPDDSYDAHAFVYTTGSGTLFNEVEGVTVTDCTFENIK